MMGTVSLRDPCHHSHGFILTVNAESDVHSMKAFWSILLMTAALTGILYRIETRYLLIEPDCPAIIPYYCLRLWLLFQ